MLSARLDARELALLERLLTYGPREDRRRSSARNSAAIGARDHGRAALRHDLALVEQGHRHRARVRPRCRASHRARHRLAHRNRRRSCRAKTRSRLAAPLFDRMTEAALLERGDAARLFVREKTRAAAHRVAGQRPRCAGDRELRARSRAVGRRDRLPGEELCGTGRDPTRRRAHDVRAGELRALPPQDLQRRLDHRRRAPAEVAVRDDPQHAREASARRALGLSRQRRGHGRRARQALLPESRERHLRRDRRAHRHSHEGRDAQPSDGDFAVSGRGNRIRRRDSRRRRHGARRETQSRSHRILRFAPAHPGLRAALGKSTAFDSRWASPIASSRRSTS